MQQLYPLFLDVSRRRVLIIGAGRVAARKARGLLAAGAGEVTVVGPAFCDEMPEGVQRQARPFAVGDLDGKEICFAATDSAELNSQVVRLCRERGILVNRADRDEANAGDFTVPAVHRSGVLTIAVSAAGSPALAVAVRDEVAAKLEGAWDGFARAAVALRGRVLGVAGLDQPCREGILRTLSSAEALAVFKQGGEDGLWSYLHRMHPELAEAMPMNEEH